MKLRGDPELVEKLFPVELNLYIERVYVQKQLTKYIAARQQECSQKWSDWEV